MSIRTSVAYVWLNSAVLTVVWGASVKNRRGLLDVFKVSISSFNTQPRFMTICWHLLEPWYAAPLVASYYAETRFERVVYGTFVKIVRNRQISWFLFSDTRVQCARLRRRIKQWTRTSPGILWIHSQVSSRIWQTPVMIQIYPTSKNDLYRFEQYTFNHSLLFKHILIIDWKCFGKEC